MRLKLYPGTVFLGLAVTGLLAALMLPQIVVVFGQQRDDFSAISQQVVTASPSDPCMKIMSATLRPSTDTTDKWSVSLELKVKDTDQLRSNDLMVQWHDKVGSLPVPPSPSDTSISRLPPLKVKILLDLDQAALYSGTVLDSEEKIVKEKTFWHKFADSLVQRFEFEDALFADVGMVYVVGTRNESDTPSVCTAPSCTYYSSGLFNTILDASERGYGGQTRPADTEIMKKVLEEEEWPQRDGEKVLVVVRWRPDGLDSLSYLFGEPSFKGRLFVLVIGRSSNLPSGWENLVREAKEKHEVGLAYVAAPPGSGNLEKTFEEMRAYFQRKRPNLRVDARFPYLLDRKMASNGQLSVSDGRCESERRPFDDNYPTGSDQKTLELPAPITLGAGLASLLGLSQTLLFISLIAYKLSPSLRDSVIALGDRESPSEE